MALRNGCCYFYSCCEHRLKLIIAQRVFYGRIVQILSASLSFHGPLVCSISGVFYFSSILNTFSLKAVNRFECEGHHSVWFLMFHPHIMQYIKEPVYEIISHLDSIVHFTRTAPKMGAMLICEVLFSVFGFTGEALPCVCQAISWQYNGRALIGQIETQQFECRGKVKFQLVPHVPLINKGNKSSRLDWTLITYNMGH